MTPAFLLATALLLGTPEPDATEAFDPFQVVGVCPIASGLRPWSVVLHSFGDDMPESAQIASVRIFKFLYSPDLDACLTDMIESDPAARKAAYALEQAIDPESFGRSDTAVRAVWTRYGVDAALREVATTGQLGPAVERLFAHCEKLHIQDGR